MLPTYSRKPAASSRGSGTKMWTKCAEQRIVLLPHTMPYGIASTQMKTKNPFSTVVADRWVLTSLFILGNKIALRLQWVERACKGRQDLAIELSRTCWNGEGLTVVGEKGGIGHHNFSRAYLFCFRYSGMDLYVLVFVWVASFSNKRYYWGQQSPDSKTRA